MSIRISKEQSSWRVGMTVLRSDAPVVGIDLGGTKILAGIVSADNKILGRAKRATPAQEGAEAILKSVSDAIDEALAAARLTRDDIGAAGIGSPGPLDILSGTILFSANMNVKNFPLGPRLSEILKRPVVLRNDVRVGGYGEFRLGAGRGFKDIVATFVGTGIGGCLIKSGEVVTGSTGNAGEIGHMIIKAGGPACGCGSRGCLEALSSRTAITRRIIKAVRKGEPTILTEKATRKSGRLKSGEIADAVNAGDHVAIKEVRRAAHFLGLALGSIINLFGPEIVIIGGGVTQALGEPWIELVRVSARAQILVDPTNSIKIVAGALGDDGGILGAALMAREEFLIPSSA